MEINNITTGSSTNATSLKWGVTACAINGGIGVPTMNATTNDHWADSNLTKSKYFNINSADDHNNTIEMFVPISAF